MEELARKLHKNDDFLVFSAYVMAEVDKLETLDGLLDMTNEKAGEEAKIRSKAAQKIRELLTPFITFKEKPQHSPEEVQKAKGKYAL